MKQNFRCDNCVYYQTCDKENKLKCVSRDYILFTTKEEKTLCDLMCGKVEINDED